MMRLKYRVAMEDLTMNRIRPLQLPNQPQKESNWIPWFCTLTRIRERDHQSWLAEANYFNQLTKVIYKSTYDLGKWHEDLKSQLRCVLTLQDKDTS